MEGAAGRSDAHANVRLAALTAAPETIVPFNLGGRRSFIYRGVEIVSYAQDEEVGVFQWRSRGATSSICTY